MIKIHNSPAFAIALICCGLFPASAFAQNKEADEEKIDPSKTKTSQSTEGGNQITKTDYFNEKGVPVKTDKATVTPEGTVKESDIYKKDNLVLKTTTMTDNFGKEIQTNFEVYKDGELVDGKITGPGGLWKVFDPKTQKYEDGYTSSLVKPFSQVPKSWQIEIPKTTTSSEKPAEKPAEKPPAIKNPTIGGELQVPYEYKFKGDSQETGKTTGMKPRDKPTLNQLVSNGAVKVEITGTGETIGPIAKVKIENVSNQSLNFSFPPIIAESKSDKYQDYASPRGQDVALRPGETKTISVMGTCLERNKPPEPPGQTGDIVLDDGDRTTSRFDWYKTQPEIVKNILRIVEAKYEAADKLEGEDGFKDFPYHDKRKCKEIVIQHSTWGDPRVSEWVHSPPEDKEDFKKIIDDQAKQHGPITRDIRKKLDKGTNAMWDGIELTSEKAKDLEPSDQYAQQPGATFEISDETGEKTEPPPPKTEEKKTEDTKEMAVKAFEKRKEAKQKRDDWKEKEKLLFTAVVNKGLAQQKYNSALLKYCLENNKDYKDLREKRDKAQQKAKEWDITVPTKNEKDAAKKDKEAFQQADEALKKLEAELEKDFQKTDEGKKDLENLNNEKKALGTAEANEKEAKDAYKKADAEAKAFAKELKGEKPTK